MSWIVHIIQDRREHMFVQYLETTAVYHEVGNRLSLPRCESPVFPDSCFPTLVCCLSWQGAGVVTTRAHIHYVVTEYGVASLFGKSLAERARELISIAHPQDR